MYNILICDDEKDIVNALKIYLSSGEYNIFESYNGLEALDICSKNNIQLVLMDIMMPVLDGISAMLELRKVSNIPVIFLSAKSEDTDKILGLDLGADDYITKPFNPAEVCARVKSALRRYILLGNGNDLKLIRNGGLEMNDGEKRVRLDGEDISLTPKEYEILKLLLENPGIVFPPKKIYELVWDDSPYGSENTVAVHIRHLREKIEIDPSSPRYVKVVWGQGYKLEKERKNTSK